MSGLKVCGVKVDGRQCPNLTAGRWCIEHSRSAGHQLYATKRWKILRDQVRQEEPFCRTDCGRLTDDIDHIMPHRGDEALFFDRSNLQGLCLECHSAKTRRGE